MQNRNDRRDNPNPSNGDNNGSDRGDRNEVDHDHSHDHGHIHGDAASGSDRAQSRGFERAETSPDYRSRPYGDPYDRASGGHLGPRNSDRGEPRGYNPSANMGGANWSGASGRGGVTGPSRHAYDAQGSRGSWQDDNRGLGRSIAQDYGQSRGYSGRGPEGSEYEGFAREVETDRDRWQSAGQGVPQRDRGYGGDSSARYQDHGPADGYFGQASQNPNLYRGERPGQGGHLYGGGHPDARSANAGWNDRGRGHQSVGSGQPTRQGPYSSHAGESAGPAVIGRRGPKGYKRSDERIKEDVCEALSDHHELDASDIEVKVQDGEVTLTGSVSDRQAKRLAETILDHVRGVEEIHNQIRVKREASSTGGARTGTSAGMTPSPTASATQQAMQAGTGASTQAGTAATGQAGQASQVGSSGSNDRRATS